MTNTNTTPAGAAIEPCPYCATTPHPKDHVEWEAEITEYAIRCPNCGALGPNDISLDRAREMWNLRRTPNAQHEQLQQRVRELEETVHELERMISLEMAQALAQQGYDELTGEHNNE